MKIKSILFTLLVFILFSGCTTAPSGEKEAREIKNGTYNIIKTSNYPVDTKGKKEFLVYHSDNQEDIVAFDAEYKRLTGEVAPIFDGNMIIAKCGQKSTGGYKISITDVVDTGRYTEVTIVLESPAKECLNTMALTNPYVVVELPKDHKDLKFVEKNIIKTCD